MLFDSLKDKFDILSPLDRSVMIPAPETRTYVIANKNGKSHLSLHIAVENLQALFNAYNCYLPEIITSIVDSGQFVLIDLNTIQTENIKFYIRLDADSYEKITSRFPFAIPDTLSITNKFISGVSFLITNNRVSQYKYYWHAEGNEMFVHRFDDSGNFIEENIEIGNNQLTQQEIIDFDSRLEGIDLTNCYIAKSTRTTGSQSYIGIVEGDDISRSGSAACEPILEHQPIDP
jgi:hypothetical protein